MKGKFDVLGKSYKYKGGVFYLVFCPKTTSKDISAMFCHRT